MPDERDGFEKSEEPTSKRREEARGKGQVAKSKYVNLTATLIAAVLVLRFMGWELLVGLERLFVGFFSLAGNRGEIMQEDFIALSFKTGLVMIPFFAPLLGCVVLAALGTGFLQTSFLWTTESLKVDPSRLSPLAGLKRMFSPESAAEFVKSLLVLFSMGAVGFYLLYLNIGALSSLIDLGVGGIILFGTGEGMVFMGAAIGIMAIMAILDYLFQRWQTEKKLRMSRQEIKEEMRQQEGDPLLKSRLRSIREKLGRQRMMTDVAQADVVITNPQELAVALRYQLAEMVAPQVVGKGAGLIAQNIRAVARERSIPLVENKSLARLLFRNVEVGQVIPENLYRAVAEVIAYVYRLRGNQPMELPSNE